MSRNDVSPFTRIPEPPAELEPLLRDAPLIDGEAPEDYRQFFKTLASAVRPADVIEWMLLKDFTDISWEIVRERRIKAQIIRLKQKETSRELSSESHSAFKRRPEAGLEERKGSKTLDPGEILARTYIDGAADIDAIDRRIAAYETRRGNLLRDVDNRRERLARALRAEADTIETQFIRK